MLRKIVKKLRFVLRSFCPCGYIMMVSFSWSTCAISA